MSPTRISRTLTPASARAFVLLPLGLVALGCGGDGSTTGLGNGTGTNGGNSRYVMTATIDGKQWSEDAAGASAVGAIWAEPGLYTITGFSTPSATTIAISLNTIRAAAQYPLGVNMGVAGGTAQVSNTTSGWNTRLSGAAGTINITLLTTTEIAGTFSFVANGTLNVPSTSTTNVTNGSFDLPIKAIQTIGPIPDNAGNVISGTIGGQPFNLATVAVTTSQTRNLQGQVVGTTLIFGGSTDTQGMGATVSGITGPGTFGLSNSVPVTTLNASLTNGTVIQSWNSAAGASSGSVTITSWSATRAKGTFTATLAGATGTTASVALTGAFDVGIP
jgi:hypothetical protein